MIAYVRVGVQESWLSRPEWYAVSSGDWGLNARSLVLGIIKARDLELKEDELVYLSDRVPAQSHFGSAAPQEHTTAGSISRLWWNLS